MHGPGAGNVQQTSLIRAAVMPAVCIWDKDRVKFQPLGHLDRGNGNAVFKLPALWRDQMDAVLFGELLV